MRAYARVQVWPHIYSSQKPRYVFTPQSLELCKLRASCVATMSKVTGVSTNPNHMLASGPTNHMHAAAAAHLHSRAGHLLQNLLLGWVARRPELCERAREVLGAVVAIDHRLILNLVKVSEDVWQGHAQQCGGMVIGQWWGVGCVRSVHSAVKIRKGHQAALPSLENTDGEVGELGTLLRAVSPRVG
jgi:hypothetical protein